MIGITRKIRRVVKAINRQLAVERQGLSEPGRGMQREGYVGGYLQALSDVEMAQRGIVDCNSRFAHLWSDPEGGDGR